MSTPEIPETICMESLAFYRLIDTVVDHVEQRLNDKEKDRWISGAEAMKLLGISSRTTLIVYRDEGKIRYTQPTKKHVLYDRKSIEDFLESKAKDTF